MTTAANAKSQDSPGAGALDLIKTIVYALLLALIIRFVVVQPFRIPSGSMQPTLLVGDYVVVTKWSYGYSKFSFAPLEGVLPSGRLFGAAPQRGDVAVFRPVGKEDNDFIKRVVGLPGDRIRLVNSVIYINNQPVQREFMGTRPWIETRMDTGEEITVQLKMYRETLPGGISHVIFERGEEADGTCTDAAKHFRCRYDNWPLGGGDYTVPAGNYFMMGDDRDNSEDSRGDVGAVPFDNFVGKAQFVFISYDKSAQLHLPWTWLNIRPDRIVRGIE
jgi:signal peptidase I